MSAAARDDVPMRTGEIAEILGWDRWRTGRWLDGLSAQDPSIVVRVNGRRMVTLASLRRVCPDIAKHFAKDHEVAEIRTTQKEQAEEIEMIAEQFGEFRRKSWEWYRGVAKRLESLEKRGAK